MREELTQKSIEAFDTFEKRAFFKKYNHCPKCSSLLVTDKACELCDYQFDLREKQVGLHPFGPKSFYFLRDQFEKDTSFFQRNGVLSNLFPKMKKRYLRHLVKRYESLLSHTMSATNNEKKVYLVEMEMIISEYFEYEKKPMILKQKLQPYADTKEYGLFLDYIDFACLEKEKRPFDFTALVLAILFLSLITVLALTFYSDFLVR